MAGPIPPITRGFVLGVASNVIANILRNDPGAIQLTPINTPQDGQSVNAAVLPAPGQNFTLEVGKDIERVKIEGRGGTVKLFHGVRDATIRVPLRLTDDRVSLPFDAQRNSEVVLGNAGPEFKLRQLRAFLDRQALGGALMTYAIENATINAFGVRRVVVTDLMLGAPRARDYLDCTLVMTEHGIDTERESLQINTLPATEAPADIFGSGDPVDTSSDDTAVSYFEGNF